MLSKSRIRWLSFVGLVIAACSSQVDDEPSHEPSGGSGGTPGPGDGSGGASGGVPGGSGGGSDGVRPSGGSGGTSAEAGAGPGGAAGSGEEPSSGGYGGEPPACAPPTEAATSGAGFDLTTVREHVLGGNYAGVPFHVGDLDHDGYLDVVAPLTQGGRIAVLDGEPGASFAPVREFVIENANSVVLRELTGDAHLDLLVLDPAPSSNQTRIFAGSGDGTFATSAIEFYVSTSRSAPLFADVAGDGQLDLVVRNAASNSIEVLQRETSTTITALTPIVLSAQSAVFTVADFNGDGYLDIVAAGPNGAEDRLDLIPGQSGKTFGARVHHDLNTFVPFFVQQSRAIVAGHLNGDAAADLLISDDAGATLFFGATNGAPVYAQRFALADLSDAHLIDADGDGHLDVVLTGDDSALVRVYYGAGNGTFSVAHEWSSGNSAFRLGSGDIDGDGDLDLLVNGGAILVLEQAEDRVYDAQAVVTRSTSSVKGVEVADMDGDGNLDLLLLDGTNLRILVGQGDGTFGTDTAHAIGGTGATLFVLYANGDAAPDVLVTHASGSRLFFGDGDGGVGGSADFVRVVMAVSDFDDDGDADFFAKTGGTLYWFEADGEGSFTERTLAGLPTNVEGVLIGDFVGDESLDLAITNWTDSAVSFFAGDGSGAVAAAGSFTAASTDPYAGVAADFTGDCRADLLYSHAVGFYSTLLYTNSGDGSFSAGSPYATLYGAQNLGLYLDDDEWRDFVHVHHGNAYCVLGLNSGGDFVTRRMPCGGGMDRAASGDLDGDGRADLVLSNSSRRIVSVALNTSD